MYIIIIFFIRPNKIIVHCSQTRKNHFTPPEKKSPLKFIKVKEGSVI